MEATGGPTTISNGGVVSLKSSLELLAQAGFAVADVAIEYAEDRELEAREIAQVWLCPCGFRYESPLALTEFSHCQKKPKKIWPR